MKLYAVIMAGGVGERFWPLSTQTEPKQFLKVFTGEPMLLTTAKRVQPDIPYSQMVVVTNRAYEKKSAALFRKHKGVRIIGEPVGKNTAPAIAAAAALIEGDSPDAVMAVFSADHIITPEAEFRKSIQLAVTVAQKKGALVCLGVKPDHPHTGLGYIETGETLGASGNAEAFRVRRFVEKPNLAAASQYVESGSFLWNCGIFVWSVASILNAFDLYMPELAEQLRPVRKAKKGPARKKALDRFYKTAAKESIDYGVLEKSDNIAVVRCPISWNDVGSWSAYYGLQKNDAQGNVLQGASIDLDSRNTLVLSDTGLTATYGLNDIFVIRSKEKLLVIHRDKIGDMKKLIERMKQDGFERFLK